MLDAGVDGTLNSLVEDSQGVSRTNVYYDAISDQEMNQNVDGYGYGTHISSVAVSSAQTPEGNYNGIAPDAEWVVVRGFDDEGHGTYLDVIRGLDWIVAHKDEHNIRVLNLSFSAPPWSY